MRYKTLYAGYCFDDEHGSACPMLDMETTTIQDVDEDIVGCKLCAGLVCANRKPLVAVEDDGA